MATIDFTDILEDVKDFLVGAISELDSSTSAVSDIDSVMDALLADNTVTAGLVVDFLYAVPHSTDSGRRTNDLWDTFLGGIILVEFRGRDATEADKNKIINMLMRAFDGGSTKVLKSDSGKIDRVNIIRIERPEKLAISDRPFYYMPFTMKVNHGG